ATCLGIGLTDRRDVDYAAGTEGRIRAVVEDVGFVAAAIGDRRRILAAHVDAAVGVIADPEFGAQPEVVVRLPSDQEGGAGTGSRLDGAIARGPVGVADNVEVIEAVAAIDESDGAV